MNQRHNREKVLSKGMDLFWRKGFYNSGVDEICRETGMTKGAFYNAFKSKEQFLLATLRAYGDLIESHLQSNLQKGKTKAFTKLQRLYQGMLESQANFNFKGCLVNNTMSEMGALNQNVSNLTSVQFERFVQAIEPTVREAQLQGDLKGNMPSSQLADIIHTVFFGFLTISKSGNLSTPKLMTIFLNTIKST